MAPTTPRGSRRMSARSLGPVGATSRRACRRTRRSTRCSPRSWRHRRPPSLRSACRHRATPAAQGCRRPRGWLPRNGAARACVRAARGCAIRRTRRPCARSAPRCPHRLPRRGRCLQMSLPSMGLMSLNTRPSWAGTLRPLMKARPSGVICAASFSQERRSRYIAVVLMRLGFHSRRRDRSREIE